MDKEEKGFDNCGALSGKTQNLADWQLDAILKRTVKLARSLNIPVSDRIIPHVFINSRRRTILGTCEKQKSGEYKIVLSEFVLSDEAGVKNVIAHEVLHTCDGCSNHGSLWSAYAKLLGNATGQQIKRTGKSERADEMRLNAPYTLVCRKCGREFHRYKRSALVKRPERYRCTCGGRIAVKK